ncbi:alpha-galactosidase [Roseibium sp. TrichSKD4]|uniref:alpha-galactosidase n=1 Tax=Roseibium sp. TrichSKD4 TaxID=744980 RepID=UPI0001E563EC|nr:alpha-galactosidase [Roseibium sp. TrichSKD4]EFO34119.1 alpha-galactosidase [Roseibium sp. TrichSKD4]
MIKTWHLKDGRQSLVLSATAGRLPEIVYWGPALPTEEPLESLAELAVFDVTGGMLDENPPLSLCPEANRTFPGHVGLVGRTQVGQNLRPSFIFKSDQQTDEALALIYEDQTHDLRLAFHISLDPVTSLIKAETSLESNNPIHLDWLAAPVFPVPTRTNRLIEFSGHWCSELQAHETEFTPGARMRDNRTGRTDHAHFPGLLVTTPGAKNTTGEVFAFHYGWSGGHKMVAEELADSRRQIQFGHARASYPSGTHFQTAPLYATYSDKGLNGAAIRFQKHLRQKTRFARKTRPVHYNCWEAVYFDHDLDELKEIASQAAALGAERFVLDDGWFGRRDDDTSGLGEWWIDERKYPDGLKPLIDHIQSLSMEFGLWFEPEMVNEDSNLFRTHPDWILGETDQIRGRQQLVLDMSQKEVRAYLYERISDLLSNNAISYIKWDHNRVLPVVDAAQAAGTYQLIDQLRTAFPNVEIESCSSGGGRIDLGILERTQRVWLSDSNDALERQRIQHDAALFLPACVTGSHVGPRTCHTSGRVLSIGLRAWTAAQRHMGFEMDPRELDEAEAASLQTVTTWWKANRDWLMNADILRLDADDPAITAELHRSEDQSGFVIFSAQTETSRQALPLPLRLTGLKPDTTYHIELTNRSDISNLSRGQPALKAGPITASGQVLMARGLTLPWQFPGTIWVLEGHRIERPSQ